MARQSDERAKNPLYGVIRRYRFAMRAYEQLLATVEPGQLAHALHRAMHDRLDGVLDYHRTALTPLEDEQLHTILLMHANAMRDGILAAYGAVDDDLAVRTDATARERKQQVLNILAPVDERLKAASPRVRRAFNAYLEGVSRYWPTVMRPTLIERAVLIGLVTEFEVLLAGVLRYFFQRVPNALARKEKSIAYRRLRDFSSMTALWTHIRNEEVDSLLRRDLEDWRKFVTRHLKLDVATYVSDWDQFREYFLRRNLFVHTTGRISQQYLSALPQELLRRLHQRPAIGVRVKTENEYLQAAIKEFESAGLVVAFHAALHLKATSPRRFMRTFHEMVQDALREGRVHVAAQLSLWGIQQTHLPFEHLYECSLTTAVIYRIGGTEPFEEMTTFLTSIDESRLPLRVRLARYAALGDADGFFRHVESITKDEKLRAELLDSHWDTDPLFEPVRSDPRYNEFTERLLASLEHD